ncbi:polysaccharide biosynthesis/export family protein [Mangrovimonas xylaniphaga]|uniref:polysaccharide biosynthesis/export family protein n=1 Tax=Mangrovimonas xylaniphaga TaxID=1645915 RepID=UPI0006B60340|nr:polysaccharide biosynthesis/export family protein [Mangrovimonas xylaniphaga]
MKYTLLVAILILGVMTSCVPHKDMLYLQDKSTATDSLQLMVETQKPYRVQINDILSIRIKVLDQDNVSIFNPIADAADLNASSSERAYYDGFTVDVHGNIRIPVLGEVNVLGRTTEEIQELLEQQLLEEQFKETANIFITVKLSGLRYTTLGELGSTGSKVLFQERVNIFEAIANSGDIPVIGDRQHVQIIRQYPQGQEIHEIDLTDKNVMQSPYYYIQPNDMIYVKPLKQKAWGTGTSGREVLTSVVAVVSLLTTTLLLINRL